jgi:hypothetical protein
MPNDAKVRAFVPLVALREAWNMGRKKLKRHLFYSRFATYPIIAQKDLPAAPRPRVLAAIVHIVSEDEHAGRGTAQVKVDRLVTTLDGLLCSFAHCRLKVLLVTMSGRHIVHLLPARLQSMLELVLADGTDPMFVGYPAQDALIERRDAHDWFMFLEDDIEIRDSAFLDKVSRFAALPGMERAVLMPNRFEYVDGVKRYIDLTHMSQHILWNKLSRFAHDGNLFAECSNHHAGIFVLSRAQIDRWAASGRDWRGADLYGGSRETAATYSLMECFTLYKPHLDNLYYLEVRHVDTKYSLMHPEKTEYTYAATTP